LKKNKYVISGILFGLAISTKLIPILLLPFFYKRLGVKHSAQFYIAAIITSVATFLPLMNSNFVDGFSQSLGFYFQKFEFNASIFYVVQEVGLLIKGTDIINIAGIVLGVLALISIFILAIKEQKEKNLLLGIFVWALFIYYTFSTNVQPWYVTPILAFSIFSRYRFAIAWSGLIFLSYYGYSETGYNENLPLVVLEYILLFGFVIYEIVSKKGKFNVY